MSARGAIAILSLLAAGGASAQLAEPLPAELEGVGIEPVLDSDLPMDLALFDQDGRPVTLADYAAGDRPVLLALAYYHCPMLCNLLVDGLSRSLAEVDLRPGEDFEIVVVSIDPADTAERARAMRQKAVESYGRGDDTTGWNFLTGPADHVRALADSVGFRYRWVEDRGEYAHGAGIFLVTPGGKLSRFLAGVRFEARTLRLGLVEASEGTIGSPIDQFVLFCFHYDETKGRYAPAARRIMSAGGAMFVLVAGGSLLALWGRERRRRTAA